MLKVEVAKAEQLQTTVKEKPSTRIPAILFLTLDEFEKVPKYDPRKFSRITQFLHILSQLNIIVISLGI